MYYYFGGVRYALAHLLSVNLVFTHFLCSFFVCFKSLFKLNTILFLLYFCNKYTLLLSQGRKKYFIGLVLINILYTVDVGLHFVIPV